MSTSNQIQFLDPLPFQRPLPISQIGIAGDYLYTWGFGDKFDAQDPKPGMRLVFEHIRELLAQKNLSFADVVKVTALISPVRYFDIYNEVYCEYLQPPFPCRTTIPVTADHLFLELDVVAYRKGLSETP